MTSEDQLGLFAAGIQGAQAFGCEYHEAASDIRQAREIMAKFPDGGKAAWEAAVTRAAGIVQQRADFIDALGTRLEHEPFEVTGVDCDALWRQFYPTTSYQQRSRAASSSSSLEEMIFVDGVVVGVIRRDLDGYVAIARGGICIRAQGATKEAAATALRRVLDREKIQFRTDGVMGGAFV